MLKNNQVKPVCRIIFLAMFACFMASAQTSVKFTFSNGQFNIAQYTNCQVWLQPESVNASGTTTLLQPRIYQITDTNASTTLSNLGASTTGGSYYRWTVPAFTSADGNNPPVTSQGDILILTTNLGTIASTTIGVTFVPTVSGSGGAWTAQTSDLRYGNTNYSVCWNTSTNLTTAHAATLLWVYPTPPFNSTNYPHGIIYTN